MIDLHSHILPGIDDGARDLSVSIAMAKAWAADGVTTVACTPHIFPGLYNNTGPQIRRAVQDLQRILNIENIPVRLIAGADAHMTQNFVSRLHAGLSLTLADSRYVLVEPPHHVAPPRMEEFFFNLMAAGYVAILTHPERLTWIKSNYSTIKRLVRRGVWMQITAGSLTGAFGRGPQYWGERMLDDGCAHILATDAHNMKLRRPDLRDGREKAARWVGTVEAEHLVYTRPEGVIANIPPIGLPMPGLVGSSSEVTHGETKTSNGGGRSRTSARGGAMAGVRGLSRRMQQFFG